MDPQVLSAFHRMASMVLMSELTGPIDDIKLFWQIISPQPWWVLLIIGLRFGLPVVWPWITGKYRVRF